MTHFDELADWTAEQDRMWAGVDDAFLHAERRAMYVEVFGGDRAAEWGDDEYGREAA